MPIWDIAWWAPLTAAPKSSAAGTTCAGWSWSLPSARPTSLSPVSYTHLDVYKRQVLADGEIVEDGTHAQLVEAGGEYASLWGRQTGAFLEA